MPKAMQASAQALPEDIQALEAAFEAAWKVESKTTGDAAVRAAIDRTGAIASKILNLAKTVTVPVRLLARLHIWGEFSGGFDYFAERADEPLVYLFRDLGADYPVGGPANAEATR